VKRKKSFKKNRVFKIWKEEKRYRDKRKNFNGIKRTLKKITIENLKVIIISISKDNPKMQKVMKLMLNGLKRPF
jgi:hypothetical protein